MAHKISSLSIFILSLAIISSLACNKQDLAALLAIRNSYPPNTFPASWYSTDPTEDCCIWDYIRCSSYTGRIQRLKISNNLNITGPIPATSITGLRFLERLEFITVPNVNGSIPPEFSVLTRLRQLAFYSIPDLVGPVPPQLAALTNLRSFNLYNTGVSGSIPSFLSELPNLGLVFFVNNKFSSIPASLNLGKLAKLGVVNWSGNKLSGSIPPFLFGTGGSAPGIFILKSNKLTGDFPASFSNKNFGFVDLSDNEFTGPSAMVFFRKSVSTTLLSLAHNKIAFNFSTVDQFPENITGLNISHNKIYGGVPESITMTRIDSLDLSYNELCGEIPANGTYPFYTPETYMHNKCLCGTPLPPCK